MVLSVVQSKSNTSTSTGQNPNATFASAPTSGNLLLAQSFIFGIPSPHTGWTLLTTTGYNSIPGSDGCGCIYYKYAGGSETAAQTVDDTTSSAQWGINLWEISGVSGTISQDFAEVVAQQVATYPSTSGAVTSFTNIANPELMVMGVAGNQSASSTLSQSAGSPTFTADTSTSANSSGGGWQAARAYETSFASTGNTVDPTLAATNQGSILVGLVGVTTGLSTTPPQVVQSRSGVSGGSGAKPGATLLKAPTSGNLLIAICDFIDTGGAPSADTGWTLDTSHDNGTFYSAVYYKYAGAGESTSQTPDGTSRTNWNCVIQEISGVGGVWANDHVATTLFTSADNTGKTFTPSTVTTSNANELIVGACVGSSSGAPDIAFNVSGGVVPNCGHATSGSGAIQAAQGFHQLCPTSSTGVTPSFSSGGVNGAWFIGAIVELKAGSGASTETADVAMVLSGVSFSAGSAREETSTAALTLAGVRFAAIDADAHSAAVTLALSGVAIRAGVHDLGTAGSGSVYFSTFGA